jgi:hypothetical protein
MHHRAAIGALLLIGISVLLGGTVFREQVAHAAATLLVREQNIDAEGNIKIHEQGTVRDADQPALQPFQTNIGAKFEPTGSQTCSAVHVPAGRRLVIEFVSFDGYLEDPAEFYRDVWLATDVADLYNAHHIAFVKMPEENHWRASEALRLYTDPDKFVQLCAERRRVGTTEPEFHGTLSGYLVDV